MVLEGNEREREREGGREGGRARERELKDTYSILSGPETGASEVSWFQGLN